MATVTLQFSRGEGFIASLIAWGTWSWASHVDFVINPDTHNELLVGANGVGGVTARTTYEVHNSSKRVERYTVEVGDENTVLEILNSATLLLGAKYDWMGIVGFVSRKDIQDKNKWFCSELVAHVFQKHGITLFNQPISRITPRDLISSPMLRKV